MGLGWLGGVILYTFLKVVSVSLKQDSVNPLETVCKIDAKLTFDLILSLFGVRNLTLEGPYSIHS